MRKGIEGREGWTLLAQDPGFRLWQRTEEGPAGRWVDGGLVSHLTWPGVTEPGSRALGREGLSGLGG